MADEGWSFTRPSSTMPTGGWRPPSTMDRTPTATGEDEHPTGGSSLGAAPTPAPVRQPTTAPEAFWQLGDDVDLDDLALPAEVSRLESDELPDAPPPAPRPRAVAPHAVPTRPELQGIVAGSVASLFGGDDPAPEPAPATPSSSSRNSGAPFGTLAPRDARPARTGTGVARGPANVSRRGFLAIGAMVAAVAVSTMRRSDDDSSGTAPASSEVGVQSDEPSPAATGEPTTVEGIGRFTIPAGWWTADSQPEQQALTNSVDDQLVMMLSRSAQSSMQLACQEILASTAGPEASRPYSPGFRIGGRPTVGQRGTSQGKDVLAVCARAADGRLMAIVATPGDSATNQFLAGLRGLATSWH